MAVIQIPNLPAAIALTGSEQLEIVQAGVSCRTTTGAIANLNASAIAALQSDVSTLQSDVSTLQVDVAALQDVFCASYYSTQTQSHGAIGNEAIITCNQTDFEYGISKVSNSQFTAPVNGVYNVQFSIQLVAPDNNKIAYVWLKKNGSSVAHSNTEIDLPNKDNGYVAAWNFLVQLNAGQYIQLAWTSNDSVAVKATDPAPYGPGIPSVILTMNLVRRL